VGTTRFALHSWTLDSTPLPEVLRIARETGWDALELRVIDFDRAAEAGQSEDDVIEMVRACGLPVAAMGARLGWMYADGDEYRELRGIFTSSCRRAAALGAPVVQCPVDFASGDIRKAAERVREIGDIAAEHGLRVALETYSIAEQFNTLARGRELLHLAGHAAVGFDVDSYHVERGGEGFAALDDLTLDEIAYVQYSDVPAGAGPPAPGNLLNRLPPGQGVVPFDRFFGVLSAKGYAGYWSYEAPNSAAWERDPTEVAREAHAATLAVYPASA
jgi:4-hydroxyphenylpyruvate dioxygenase